MGWIHGSDSQGESQESKERFASFRHKQGVEDRAASKKAYADKMAAYEERGQATALTATQQSEYEFGLAGITKRLNAGGVEFCGKFTAMNQQDLLNKALSVNDYSTLTQIDVDAVHKAWLITYNK